jgi:hypothetical protein
MTWLRLLFACLLIFNSSWVLAKDDFEGVWYSCVIELVDFPELDFIQISKTGSTYDVSQERMHWSFSGRGKLINKQLHVKGCYAYDGEPADECDASNPPLVSKYKKSFFKRKHKNLDVALAKGEWIRLSRKEGELDELRRKCRELAEQKNTDKAGLQ